MNPAALIIALPILKGLFEGGNGSVSPTQPVVTSSPLGQKQTLVTSVFDKNTGPTKILQAGDPVTEPITGVVVPFRPPSDTVKQIADRLKYGSGL